MQLGLAHDRRNPGSMPPVLGRVLGGLIEFLRDGVNGHIMTDLLAGLKLFLACSNVFLAGEARGIMSIARKSSLYMRFLDTQVGV